MPTITDSAVCIRRWEFSETSQTVSLFTREHGIIRGLAKGARREKGSFSGGIDILARGQVQAIVKSGGDLATVTQWHLERSYTILRESLEANRAGWYMADLCHHMITAHDPHPNVFDALVASLEAMSAGASPALALLNFQWALLRETGYQPQVQTDAETGESLAPAARETFAFSAAAGGIVADSGAPGRWRVRGQTVRLLQSLARGEALEALPAGVLERANRLLAAYIREIIGVEPPAMRFALGKV